MIEPEKEKLISNEMETELNDLDKQKDIKNNNNNNINYNSTPKKTCKFFFPCR